MFDTNHIASLVKNVLYILGGVFVLYLLFWRGWILGILLIPIVLGIGFFVYVKVKELKAAGRSRRDASERSARPDRPSEASRSEDAPIIDDGKIRITDLSDAKEVDFEKE